MRKHRRIRYFIEGMGTAFDLFGVIASPQSRKVIPKTVLEAFVIDANALEGDMHRVGKDLWVGFLSELQKNSHLSEELNTRILADLQYAQEQKGKRIASA